MSPAQTFQPQFGRGGFAELPQSVVLAAGERMLDAAVANHDSNLPDHRHVLDGWALKINFNGVKRLAEQRGYLVEHSRLRADEFVFGRLADFRQLEPVRRSQR